jgi:hypothetical protein
METLEPAAMGVARDLLHDLGYSIVVRTDPWLECAAFRDAETWVARGATEEEAFGALLAQMLPSGASRALLIQHIERALGVRLDAPAHGRAAP